MLFLYQNNYFNLILQFN